jgi:hypothetical protein
MNSLLLGSPCQNNSLGADRQISALVGICRRSSARRNFKKWTRVGLGLMKTKSSKTNRHIPKLVVRGFAIHQQLSLLNEEFKKIKERLKEEAAARPGEHLPLLEKDSEGTQWLALGKGCECRIVFPEAKIRPDFDPSGSDFLNIRLLAGNHFKSLFRKVTIYRPVDRKSFRGQVNTLLASLPAGQLLELCSTLSEPKAVWKARAAAKPSGKKAAAH